MLGCLQVRQADRPSEPYGTMPNQDWRLSWRTDEPTPQQRQQQNFLSLMDSNIDPALGQLHAMSQAQQGGHARHYRPQHDQQSQRHYTHQAQPHQYLQQLQQWGFPSQQPLAVQGAASLAASPAMPTQQHLGVSPGGALDQSRMSAAPTLVLSDSLDADAVFDDGWVDPAFKFEGEQHSERRSSELFPPCPNHNDSFSAPCSPALRAGSASLSVASYSAAASPTPSHAGLWDRSLLDPDLVPAGNFFTATATTAAAAASTGSIYSTTNTAASSVIAARTPEPAEHESVTESDACSSLTPAAAAAATSSSSPTTAALRSRSASAGRTRAGPDWMPEDVREMGCQPEGPGGSWRCTHPGCGSTRTFLRACDLRKHYRAHTKSHFCTVDGCPRFYNGFSSEKDCRRHMRSHNPNIECPAEGCGRKFSRVDNMRKHHEAIHQRRHPHRRRSAGLRGQEAGSPESVGDEGASPVLEGQTNLLY